MINNSPLKAIRAYCIDCGDGTYSEVRACPVTDCPLYGFRFGIRPQTVAKKEEAKAVLKTG